jgi:hypothetical protein
LTLKKREYMNWLGARSWYGLSFWAEFPKPREIRCGNCLAAYRRNLITPKFSIKGVQSPNSVRSSIGITLSSTFFLTWHCCWSPKLKLWTPNDFDVKYQKTWTSSIRSPRYHMLYVSTQKWRENHEKTN